MLLVVLILVLLSTNHGLLNPKPFIIRDSSFQMKLRKSKNSDFAMLDTNEKKENMMLTSGPAHISSIPKTLGFVSRQETIKTVVTLAVIWIAFTAKFNELKSTIRPYFQQNSDITLLKNGSSYRDIDVGSVFLKDGDEVLISVSVNYNGMNISPLDYSDSSISQFPCIYDSNIDSFVLTQFKLNGLGEAIIGMTRGGKRRVKIRSDLLFNYKLPSIIPDNNSIVTVDIQTL